MFERTKTKSNRNRLVFLGMKEIDSFANVIHHVLEKIFFFIFLSDQQKKEMDICIPTPNMYSK